MPKPLALFLGCVFLVSMPGSPAPALDDADPVDYAAEVKPILELFCYECHGPIDAKAGLRLDSYPGLIKGSEAGPIVEKGNVEESLLIDVLQGKDGMRMPPEGNPVPDEDISIIRRWISEGAKGPEDEKPVDPNAHWSFLPPRRPALPPTAETAWVRNPIDAFLSAGHQRKGVTPAPEADPATLLRRVYLDLTGLAPTREQLHAFLSDPAPDAYEQLVDRLLESPAHGERWGRHWMDVWRYSDWYGYGQEIRNSQPHIWRWRDWIVENLNRDTPYNQMVTSMLAADEATPGNTDELRATGYLVRSWYKFNRNVWLENTVEHTGKAFLGLTFNCAKCHDHKYDPIAQEDFYRLRAVFEPYQIRTDAVPGQPDTSKDGLVLAYDASADAPTYLFEKGDEARPVKDRPLSPGLPALFAVDLKPEPISLPPEAYYPGFRAHVRDQAVAAAERAVAKAEAALEKARPSLGKARDLVAAFESTGGVPSPLPSHIDSDSRFLFDDFSSARPDLWTTGSGAWEYKDGRLIQSQDGPSEHALVSGSDHPQDFQAEFRFRITGGSTYRSVGLTFDRDDHGNGQSVYLSAHAPGPKLQLSHKQAGQSSYPESGQRKFATELGRAYTLRIVVRDQLLNAYVDETLTLVAKLAGPRRPGKLSVWAFDASAEFLGFAAGALPDSETLASSPRAEQPYVAPPSTIEEAKAALARAESEVALAELVVRSARADRDSVNARAEADKARFEPQPDAPRIDELARAASRAERAAGSAKADEALARAEITLADLKQKAPGDAKKIEEAEKAVATSREASEKARKVQAEDSTNYSPLTPVYPATSTGRRLALARWISSRDNPLTARVAVNHIWLRHFGSPLVPTTFDFGRNGKAPTHPELLDWLAVEFMESGWSMKHLHRLMVTSAAYRMRSAASGPDDPNSKADPTNSTYWRMNPRRMESELIRDNVLHAAGSLDLTVGGPELDQAADESTYRRSLYYRHAAEKQSLFLKLFDAPNVNACYRRDESVVPQQALALANSALVQAQARLLALRLAGIHTADPEFVSAAFETILGRPPHDDERALCLDFLDDQAQTLSEPARLSPFPAGPSASVAPSADPRQRAREGLVQVLFNHNDFVTIR